MRFRKDLACFLVMILTISVVLWLGENVLAEGVSANTMSVSENTLMTEEVKENNIVSFAADDIANGTDGNITWAIDVDGKLVVNGSGDFLGGIPWGAYSSSITSAVVEITGMTNASRLLDECKNLIDVDLSGFDTSNVTNMRSMFYGCSNLSELDLSNFNTINVTDMSLMFDGCSNLSKLDLSNFNTINVTDMSLMFFNCNNLNILDLSGFDTSNVTNMSSMFYSCSNLSELDLSRFDTSNVANMGHMFSDCNNLMSLDLNGFDTSKVTDMAGMFASCENLTSLNLSGFDTSKVTDMADMFENCVNLKNLNLSSFDTSKVTDMTWMFFNCSGLSNLDLTSFDTSNVRSMGYMFNKCNNLSNLDLTSFDTSNVKSITFMFNGCSSLTSLDLSNFDTSNITDMHGMFEACGNLKSLNLSGFDTSNVTDMQYMFYNCSNLTSLNLSSFDTSNVTRMWGIFSACDNLSELDLSNFNTINVIGMSSMFKDCSNLSELDLSNFNTINVTDMDSMFSGCNNLRILNLSTFDTLNVTNMDAMFQDCSNLSTLDLSSFDTSNVTNMDAMFQDCSNLSTLDLSSFNTSNVTSMDYMFYGCSNLKKLDLSTFDASNIIRINRIFRIFDGCNSLVSINTPYNLTIFVALPYDESSVWCLEDGTEVTELPKNLDHSVLLIKKTIQTPDNPIDENDQWLQVTGAANDNNNTYIVKNNNQFVLDTLFDTLYNNTYQTLFINNTNVDLSQLAPVFSVKGSVKAYVQGEEQVSGESIQDFSGGPVAYRASNGDETREYFITFVKKESGPKLFVNGPSNREVYLTNYFNNIHDILIANIGDETLTGIKVELLNATHVKLDDAATTGLENNNTLSAFTKIPSSGESVSVMTNLGKIRLVPDGEGEIQGTLVISADGQAPVYIELSGYSSNPKITTTTTDLNMEDVVRVKYVPYSYTVETNNIDTENTITFSLEEGRLAEGLQIYPATGEIYGVPLETGEFPIKVKATYSRPEYLPSYADIILTVKDNTDGNVYNASDNGYELVRPVGKETSSGSNDFVLTRKGNQLFVSAGPYHEFVDFWLNGQKLIEGEDYTKESGSTRITVRAQTFINKTDAKGTNTFAAEFRTAGDSCDNLRRTAQNFRINFKKGSSSKSRSDSDERTVTTMAAVSSKVSFAMRMVNPSGLPLSGLTIEVHSTPKVSQTNQNGMAAFYDVESGTHTLFVKDKDGNILASTDFEILFGDATKLQNMQLTVKSGSRFTLDAQLDENVLTFVKLQEGDVHQILSVNTGDNSDYILWIFMMFISTSLGIGIYQNRKQSKIER